MRRSVAGTFAAVLAALSAACGDGDPAQPGPLRGGLHPEEAAQLIALQNRGIGLLERYDYVDAVVPLRECVKIAPWWTTARVHLALALLHQGTDTRPEAREILDGVLKEQRDEPRAAFLAAWLAENAGETEKAVALYRHAYKVTGEDALVGARLGIVLAGIDGSEDEALRILEAVHARRPALVAPVNQLMLLHRQRGDDATSDAYLAKLTALKGLLRPDNESAEVGEDLAHAYGGMGALSAADRSFATPFGHVGTQSGAGAVTARIEDVSGWTAGALPPGAPYLGAAVLDFDRDGDMDVFVCGGTGPCALLRNDGGKLTDVAVASGVDLTGAYAVAAGEVDVDPSAHAAGATPDRPPGRRARVDLVLVRKDGLTLLRNLGDGRFEDATKDSGLAADPGGARAALLWDADQDGDLDLFVSGEGGQKNRLWANRGPGTFTDATAGSGLAGDGGPYGPAAVLDFDEDYDLDLVVSRPSAPPAIYANDRLLKFRSVEPPKGAGPAPHGILAADFHVGPDGVDAHEDVLLLGDAATTVLKGTRAGFDASAHSFAASGGAAAALDTRLSGDRDVVYADGALLWGRIGAGPTDLRVFQGQGLANVVPVDLDGTGGEELLRIVPGKPLQRVVYEGAGRGNALVLDLEGVIRNDLQAGWSNLEGRGALVEVKSGTLWQRRRVGNPQGFACVQPHRLVFGIGSAKQADFVRILWPDGVQHAVLDMPSGEPQPIVEEQRRPSSCPLLFSWDGERWAFVTDFLGVGGVGFLVAPGVYGPPDPTESVKVDASLVRPRDGNQIVFKLHEAMEEVCYVDHADLEVLDHPADVTVFPDERFAGEPPFPDGRTLAYREEILPVVVRDAAGADVTERLAKIDRRYPDAFRLHPRLLGATDEAVLDLDFGDRLAGVAPGDGIALYAHGWIEYGYTRTSVAAAGEGFAYQVPTLEALDAKTGAWRTLVANLGYPAGFPRVMTYDVTGLVSRDTPRLRIRTNFEVYWDRVWLARKLDAEANAVDATVRRTILPPASSDLRWVGYPREYSPDGRIPRIYDYQTMDPSMPWKTVAGDYTKFGDVTPLLLRADDMYVVFGKGEEIEVRFDAAALPPLPAGSVRSFVLRFTGWCKGQEIYTAHGWTVEPLPFLGMSHYPYRDDERYPDDEAHRRYRAEWNTRRVR